MPPRAGLMESSKTTVCRDIDSGRSIGELHAEPRTRSTPGRCFRREDLPMSTTLANQLSACSIRANSLSHMQEVFSARYGPHVVRQEDRSDRLDARYASRSFASSSVNYLQYGARVRIDPGLFDSFYLVHIPVSGHAALSIDGEETIIAPGTATIAPPSAHLLTHWSADCRQIMLQLNKQRLEGVLAGLIAQPIRRPVRFQPLAQSETTRPFFGFVEYLARILADDTATLPSFVSEQIEQTVIKLLLASTEHSYSEGIRSLNQGACPRHVARAYDFMLRMSGEAITIDDLVRVSGVGRRALHDGFRRFKHMSPMACLRAIRLERARAALAEASENASVTEIAYGCGFQHLGRFAKSYYDVFGELPSHTLNRS